MNKWTRLYLCKKLESIREIQFGWGWMTGDKLDHGLVRQLDQEARGIERALAL